MKFRIKIDWKRVKVISLRVFIASAFLFTVGFTEHRRSGAICKEVSIDIEDSLGHSFVEKNDIEQLIQDKFGKLKGKTLLSINISMLEKIIDNNPFVLKSEVFSTIDGKLKIAVKQRTPVVRIINAFNESYYIDSRGVLMPTSDKFTARVVVANGNIFSKESEGKIRKFTREEVQDSATEMTVLEKIFALSDYVSHDEFWNAQIEQIYVSAEGEIELIPRVGNQTIIFGNEKDMEEKFNKLFLLYTEGFSKTGWNQYHTINLTFTDQVVCSKK